MFISSRYAFPHVFAPWAVAPRDSRRWRHVTNGCARPWNAPCAKRAAATVNRGNKQCARHPSCFADPRAVRFRRSSRGVPLVRGQVTDRGGQSCLVVCATLSPFPSLSLFLLLSFSLSLSPSRSSVLDRSGAPIAPRLELPCFPSLVSSPPARTSTWEGCQCVNKVVSSYISYKHQLSMSSI